MELILSTVCLPEIAVIGKEGLCTSEKNISSELWQEANAHFAEVAPLGMKEADGSFVGFWGVMTDETRAFLPWTENFSRGLYLAGIEVCPDTPVPEGWTMWVMPARTYLTAEVTPETYGDVFFEVITKIIPEKGLTLAGAVCDHTRPKTGQNFLFFPVE